MAVVVIAVVASTVVVVVAIAQKPTNKKALSKKTYKFYLRATQKVAQKKELGKNKFFFL